ncbi:MAG: helix-turn-helix transcriptional regulator [Alphaproteobacteria bacterium]
MDGERKTRRAILDRLKQEGPHSAGRLAEALALSPMAIRLHLYALRDQGLITAESEPRPVGRPAMLWRLTDAAAAFFPDGHADLATDLIGTMRAAFGEDGLERIVALRAGKQIASYRAALADAPDLAGRVAALAARRTAEGYMAHAEADGDGWLLVENHCPICAAARACAGLCRSELAVFRAALGPEVSVERTDHILAGARRCAYRVTPCTSRNQSA